MDKSILKRSQIIPDQRLTVFLGNGEIDSIHSPYLINVGCNPGMEGYKNKLKGHLLNQLEFYFPGFWHEQSRADRDGYVTIHKGNIMRGMEYNFMKYSLAKINHLGAKYDTCSVMHYGAYAFSRVRRILLHCF